MTSVLETIDIFYADVVQHIKPWTPRPVKVRDDEPLPRETRDSPQRADDLPADRLDGRMTQPVQTATAE